VTYANSSVIQDLFLNAILTDPAQLLAASRSGAVLRYTLPLSTPGMSVTGVKISSTFLELPTINDAYFMRNYTYVYGFAPSANAEWWFDSLVKVNVLTAQALWWSEPGCFPGEAVFVARPGATDEDDGVLLSVILDSVHNSSFLLILDARDLSEVARVNVDYVIRFGFHGRYYQV